MTVHQEQKGLVFESTGKRERFKSQSGKHGSKATYYMTRSKEAKVFRAQPWAGVGANMRNPCAMGAGAHPPGCGEEMTSKSSLRGKNNAEGWCLRIRAEKTR